MTISIQPRPVIETVFSWLQVRCNVPRIFGRDPLPNTRQVGLAVRRAWRGRGEIRLAVRGMPGVGYFSHCAATVVVTANKIITNTMGFITAPSWAKRW